MGNEKPMTKRDLVDFFKEKEKEWMQEQKLNREKQHVAYYLIVGGLYGGIAVAVLQLLSPSTPALIGIILATFSVILVMAGIWSCFEGWKRLGTLLNAQSDKHGR